jgi:hypothetical protein
VFDARPEGFRYLLLAFPCAFGEGPCFSVVGDEDGLGYGGWHVALAFPLQPASCAPAPVVKAATERRVAARIATSTVAHPLKILEYVIPHPFRVGGVRSLAPRFVTAGIIPWYEGLRIPQTDYLLSAAEEAGPEAAVLHGVELGFEADPVFREGRFLLCEVHLFLEEALALGL